MNEGSHNMSDPATRLFSLAMKWKKTSGGVLLAVASATVTFALTQWRHQDARISSVESAQTKAFTTSEVDRNTINNLAQNFQSFRDDYRQDIHDVRQALMIPRPHTSATAAVYPQDSTATP